jgi:microcystin-dependent protein
MPNVTNSPNMNLPVPIVGQESGPQYGIDIDSCLAIIDQHNHSPGSGVPVTPSGLSMTADLPMLGNNVTNVRSLRLSPQGTTISLPADIGCLYESGIDLYYNDGSGTAIRITQAGGVAGTPGSISNLLAPASASYVGANSTFVWQSAVNTPANMDFGSAILRNLTVNSFGLTLAPPNAMGSNTTITLPTLPASQSLVAMDSSGNMSASVLNYQALNPTGAVIMFAGTSAPSGYLLCDGSAISRTTYSALFGVIGVANGNGDGSTTFNLPDMRGMFPRGVDNGRGVDPDAASRTAANPGGNTGDNVGSTQTSTFAAHNHTYTVTVNSATLAQPTGAVIQQIASLPTTNTGTTGGSETRPVNNYLNFIIKT